MSLSFAAAQDNGSPITVRNQLTGPSYSCRLSAHNSIGIGSSLQTVLAGLAPKRSTHLNALLLLD